MDHGEDHIPLSHLKIYLHHNFWKVDLQGLVFNCRWCEQGGLSRSVYFSCCDCSQVALLDLAPAHSLHEGVQHVLVQGVVSGHCVGHRANICKLRKVFSKPCTTQSSPQSIPNQPEAGFPRQSYHPAHLLE